MALESANFQTYIYRVLKQVHPDTGLSGTALSAMNNLVRINIEKIMIGVNQLMLRTGKKTIGSREIQSATRLALPGELAKHGVSEGTRAVTKYISAKSSRADEKKSSPGKLAPVSRSYMAGLQFPVTRIQNLMMGLSTVSRKTDTAAVYLAAVCEYLTAEVLELSGNAARVNKRVRITPRHIMLAVRNDTELDRLYRNAVFAGGVTPHISSAILPEKKVEAKPKAGAKKTAAKRSAAQSKKTSGGTKPKPKAKASPAKKKASVKQKAKNNPAKKNAPVRRRGRRK
jgi:histone H2A